MTLILNGTSGITDVDGTASAPALTGTDTDTGVFFPAANTLGLSTGGTERARIDSSGNLGLGVTPSAWTLPTMQFGSDTSFGPYGYLRNGYYDGSNFKYISSTAASRYAQSGGQHLWFNAASGTAGNAISFTQAMTLDASGKLLVGWTTAPTASASVIANGIQCTNTSGGGGYLMLGTSGGGQQFYTHTGVPGSESYTERARIDSSGNFLVGRTAAPYLTADDGVVITPTGVMTLASNGTAARNVMSFVNNAAATPAEVGYIQTNGSSTSYATSSDYRLKENIAPMTGALSVVARLKPVTYTWKADGSDGQGFIAHELQAVVPDAVMGEKDAVETYTDEEGNEQTRPKYQGIDTSFLVATLTAAIQELKSIVDAQASEIAALKGNA